MGQGPRDVVSHEAIARPLARLLLKRCAFIFLDFVSAPYFPWVFTFSDAHPTLPHIAMVSV